MTIDYVKRGRMCVDSDGKGDVEDIALIGHGKLSSVHIVWKKPISIKEKWKGVT